jgi:hypothetical protein
VREEKKEQKVSRLNQNQLSNAKVKDT